MKRLSLRIFLLVAFTLSITPSAFAADTSAPVLVDWKLIDSKTDISNGDGVLRIQFSLSDESDISDPLSNVGSTTTTQQTGFAFPKLISKVGNVSTYTAEATVKFGQAPGVWRWLLFPLRDAIGNSSQGFGPGGSWPINVWVYDKDFTETKRFANEAAAAKVIADAKGAAELKAAADKAAADKLLSEIQAKVNLASSALSQLEAEVDSLMKKYPSMKTELNLYKKKIASFANVNPQNLGTVERNLAGLTSQLNRVKLTYEKIARGITCVKGNKLLKVVDVRPKCPAGYKLKK